MKKWIYIFIALVPSIAYADDVSSLFAAAQSACTETHQGLEKIKTLMGVSTGASAVGTVTSGTALVTGLAKAKTDKELAKMTAEDLYKYAEELEETMVKLNEERAELEKKSKTLGNVRTGMMAASTATSVTSAATSGATIKMFEDTLNNMHNCQTLSMQLGDQKTDDDNMLRKIKLVKMRCSDFDYDNITKIKKLATANTGVATAGAATGLFGTIASALANSERTRGDDTFAGMKKEKNLNTGANIAAGVTTATSLTSVVLSGSALSNLKRNAQNAADCVKAFQ